MSENPKRLPRSVDTSRDFLTVKDVAAHLTIGVSTVWRQVAKGSLPEPVRIGGATRWRRSDIEAAFQAAS